MRRAWAVLALVMVVGLVASGGVQAQQITLTPQQQQMLQLLSPSQRQAAMQALNDLNQSRLAAQQGAQGAAQQPAQQQGAAGGQQALLAPQQPTGPPRLSPGDTVVLTLKAREDDQGNPVAVLTPQEQALAARLRMNNPYQLDDQGRIDLPSVDTIALAGLTEEEAGVRLSAEEALANFDVEVRLLPLTPTGTEALKPFGYDFFGKQQSAANAPSASGGLSGAAAAGAALTGGASPVAGNSNIPVPMNYVVGPGDTVSIQLFGNENNQYELVVDRDGVINIPELGPQTVAGLSFQALRDQITQLVSQQLIGTQASVTLGQLRSVQVFVLGEVPNPGSYAVSALSTVTGALYAEGGVLERGSLRNIQVKREGDTVSTLDLYDMLLAGDNSGDRRLQDGDVVFVPTVGRRVSVAGEVKRPAIYEYRGEISAQQAVALAGGLTSAAFGGASRIQRLVPGQGNTVVNVNLGTDQGRAQTLRDGDVLTVPRGVAQLEQAVSVNGNVYRPGDYQWRSGLRLTDVLASPRDLKPNSDTHYVLIRRERVPNGPIDVMSADLEAAWAQPSGAANVALAPRDRIYVFDLENGRNYIINPLLEELRLRSSRAMPTAQVRVSGQVNVPGVYPLEPGMHISDLVRAGGGLSESAYLDQAELTRYQIVNGQSRETELINVDLARAVAGDSSQDLALRSDDLLTVRQIPRWRDQQTVQITGEVAFPGTYPISPGETLSSVLKRAGGLSEFAFPEGSVFVRENLKQRERQQLDQLANRLQTDLVSLALTDPSNANAATTGRSLLTQLRDTQPVGRLVIDLRAIADGDASHDIVLRDGDQLMVPQQTQEVTVLGEVQYATSHVYREGLSRDDYIAMSGGLTVRADKKRVYVVRANGEVETGGEGNWFSPGGGFEIHAGDTIVAPLDTDRVRPLQLWTNATQIIYNLAIAAAAVNSF